jgi:hypothetical protein
MKVRVEVFELKHDFQGARRRQSTEKLPFAIEIRQSSGCFSPWSDHQMPSAVSSTRSIGAN